MRRLRGAGHPVRPRRPVTDSECHAELHRPQAHVGALLLVVVSFLSYLLLSIPDTDVGRQLLGQGADQAAVDAKNAALGLDRPVLAQYADWLAHAVRGDLGTSWFTSEDVGRAVTGRLPVTASLMLSVTLDYVRTLRARGLPFSRIVLRHVLRNASAPALSVLGMQFVSLLGGAVIVEQIFGLPGVGSMTVTYTVRGDIPVLMALVMLTVIGVVLINLLVDIVIAWLNPKVRTS